ncbi:hypothetical protein LTR99_003953 [Exophiala xenobiotica]|nr:hypothetical protein LTR99_003953 [Exophiala xenobiotica]KAK5435420.1 hypothetical protein LTR34_002924 [Exophiala xenobiotica]KAK5549067.1 hypothetical protein LTR23_000897 [Chaetothyriales sp. CCFEE 6169]
MAAPTFVGVCGSDVHFWNHGGINGKYVSNSEPLVMGHEASGTVYAVGSAVKHLKPGDNYKLPADFCYRLPAGVSLQEGVLAEPLAVAAHAVRMVDIRPGQSVVIFGSGTIGLVCGAVARMFGAKKIVAVDIVDHKLEFASSFNTCSTFKPDLDASPEENAARIIHDNDLGLGADAVIEASGAESSIITAVQVLRPGGSCVQTGLGKPVINFPIVAMSEKELHVHGAFRYKSGDYQVAMDVLEARTIPLKKLITNIFDFEKTTDAWEATKQGRGIKNMIRGYGCSDSARTAHL